MIFIPRKIYLLGFLGMLLAAASCSHLDGPGPACGGLLEYDADSLSICFSDSAVAYAGTRENPAHYNVEAYLLREFKVARDPEWSLGDPPYELAFVQWKLLPWESRRAYLPYPYSHDILGASDAGFMYLIATYPEQFGYGWTDTYPEGTDLSDPTLGNIWIYDDPQTVQFDGNHGDYDHYLSLLIYLR